MASLGFGHSTLKCRGDSVLLHFQVTGDATPALTSDPDSLVTDLTDTAAGKITCNLTHRYKLIYAWANIQNATGQFTANCVPSASLTAANTILVSTFDTDATAALADTTLLIDVFMLVQQAAT